MKRICIKNVAFCPASVHWLQHRFWPISILNLSKLKSSKLCIYVLGFQRIWTRQIWSFEEEDMSKILQLRKAVKKLWKFIFTLKKLSVNSDHSWSELWIHLIRTLITLDQNSELKDLELWSSINKLWTTFDGTLIKLTWNSDYTISELW